MIKKGFKKAVQHLFILPACVGYITSGVLLSQISTEHHLARTAIYAIFLLMFTIFGGSVISMMDLKYIGKGFRKDKK